MKKTDGFPYQLTGDARNRALERCRQVVAAWGLNLPSVCPPLVLDFGLGRFAEIGEIEFWVANESEPGYCGKFLFVDDGQTCPGHKHARKHETFFIVKGSVRMVVDDAPRTLAAGDTLVMEPGRRHSFTGLGPALILEVSMPSLRGDNFFDDRSIGAQGTI